MIAAPVGTLIMVVTSGCGTKSSAKQLGEQRRIKFEGAGHPGVDVLAMVAVVAVLLAVFRSNRTDQCELSRGSVVGLFAPTLLCENMKNR